MEYMPALTPVAPPQLIGISGSPMERLGIATYLFMGMCLFFSGFLEVNPRWGRKERPNGKGGDGAILQERIGVLKEEHGRTESRCCGYHPNEHGIGRIT